MKTVITIIFATLTLISFSQRMTFEDWESLSKENYRLLPKYGEIEKTKSEKKADKEFMDEIMNSFDTKRDASNHMIDLGFKYLYRGDFKTAMYRFNQAYLLDENNSNIYWGYGAIYIAFGQYEIAKKQYEEGLKINSTNSDILVDYGTCFLGNYYQYFESNPELAMAKLDTAIIKIQEAYKINPENANASYKLSICYLYSNNCEKAYKYLDISEKLGNTNITESYKIELEYKCNKDKLDCSSVRIGKFKTESEMGGITLIERTETYQIEENEKAGYKLKLEVKWLDDCTYQLAPVADLLNPDNTELPKMILTCKIIKINEDGYTQISTSNFDETLVKIKVLRVK